MKKIISLILLISMIISFSVFAKETKERYTVDDIEFGKPVDLGTHYYSVQVPKGTVTFEDGRWVALAVTQGAKSVLQVVDVETGELIRALDVPNSTGLARTIVTMPNYDVYFGTQARCHLYKYSPVTKKITDYGSIAGETATFGLCYDDDNNLWIGTYPHGKLVKFDIKSETFTDYGNRVNGESYLFNTNYYKGKLYFTAFGKKDLDLYTFDVKSEKSGVIKVPETIKSPQFPQRRGKYLLCTALAHDDTSLLIAYDLDEGKWTDVIMEDIRNSREFSPLSKDGTTYFVKDNYVYELDINTLKTKKTSIFYPSAIKGSNEFLVTLPIDGFEGENHVEFGFNGDIMIYNLKSEKVLKHDSQMVGEPGIINWSGFGPDGKYYMTAYMGTYGLEWDILGSGECKRFWMGQADNFRFIDNIGYFGVYTNAELFILDTEKEYDKDKGNPYVKCSVGEEQDRVFNMLIADDKVCLATFPKYTMLGGALAIYDPKTEKMETYRNIVKNHSVTAMAYKDGKLYCGTSVCGGLGIDAVEDDAKLFIFDMEKKEKILEKTVKIPTSLNPTAMVSGLIFTPDGELIGMSYNSFFKINPETLDIEKAVSFIPDYKYFYTTRQQVWCTSKMSYDERTGLIFTSPHGNTVNLYVLDPKTLDYKNSGYVAHRASELGPDGNVYSVMSKKNTLYKYPIIIKGDYSKIKLENKFIIKNNVNKAIINGKEVKIDENPKVTPMLIDNRLMVPLRFLAENMGYKVMYNEAEKEAIVYNENDYIKLQEDNEIININGEKKNIYIAPKVISGRTYIHVRTFGELIKKNVYWDESGMVIINKDGTKYEKEKDPDVIKYADDIFGGVINE